MSVDWYRHFFHGLALELWRKAVTPELTRSECDFVVAELAPDGPERLAGRLLDVPSGNGRHALALAERGYRVTGVDLSAEFVAEARARAGSLPVDFVLADMRDLPSEASF